MAIKTIKTNWRVEIRFPSLVSNCRAGEAEIREKMRRSTAELLLDGQCSQTPRGIEIRYDEMEICDVCGRSWKSIAHYHGEPRGTLFFCRHCGSPERDDDARAASTPAVAPVELVWISEELKDEFQRPAYMRQWVHHDPLTQLHYMYARDLDDIFRWIRKCRPDLAYVIPVLDRYGTDRRR